MNVLLARWAICAALAAAFTDANAEESYSQRTRAVIRERAEQSMAVFQASLAKTRASGENSRSRILLSFDHYIGASDAVGAMQGLGIEIEDLQVAVGEEVYAFAFESGKAKRADAEARHFIKQREAELRRMIAGESMEEARHWLTESLDSNIAYQERLSVAGDLLISGASCSATNEQIARLMLALPSTIRAVEYQGARRGMSLPIEVYAGPDE